MSATDARLHPNSARIAALGPATRALALLAFLAIGHAVPAPAAAATSSAPPAPAEWVGRSNQNASVLLEVMARFDPEGTGRMGVPRKFNDFVLAQGGLPPALLRKAVVEEFIPGQLATGAVAP